MTPERLNAIRWQAKRHREMSPNPLTWTDAAVQREELIAHIDELRIQLATAKADALEEATELFHPGAGYGGATVHSRLRTRARDYRGDR